MLNYSEDFRKYFDPKALDDALLRTYVTPAIVYEASQFVEATALSYNVLPNMIKDPTPYIVERLATLYAYKTASQRKATFSKGHSADEDSFALKYRMYKELLDDLLSKINYWSFTEGDLARKRKFPATLRIARN